MIDFFFRLGVVFIGLAAFLLTTLIVAVASAFVAMIVDDWWRARRYRALQRHHDLRTEK